MNIRYAFIVLLFSSVSAIAQEDTLKIVDHSADMWNSPRFKIVAKLVTEKTGVDVNCMGMLFSDSGHSFIDGMAVKEPSLKDQWMLILDPNYIDFDKVTPAQKKIVEAGLAVFFEARRRNQSIGSFLILGSTRADVEMIARACQAQLTADHQKQLALTQNDLQAAQKLQKELPEKIRRAKNNAKWNLYRLSQFTCPNDMGQPIRILQQQIDQLIVEQAGLKARLEEITLQMKTNPKLEQQFIDTTMSLKEVGAKIQILQGIKADKKTMINEHLQIIELMESDSQKLKNESAENLQRIQKLEQDLDRITRFETPSTWTLEVAPFSPNTVEKK